MFEAEQEIQHVYFPAGGVMSLVVMLEPGEVVEAAMVGADASSGPLQRLTDAFLSAAELSSWPV